MKKTANKNLTSFVDHLDQQYGKRGTAEREKFEEGFLEPELRPEYVKKLQKIKKQKGMRFKSVDQLRKSIENA